MAETSMFFDTVSYSEADQAIFNAAMCRPQGIFRDSPLGELFVAAVSGNMTVTVTNGEASIQGFYYKNTSGVVLPIANNASGSTRIDRVVLRLNRASNSITAAVVQGVPGAGTPALTQVVGGTWEFPLVDVTVANGSVSIIAGNLTDRRTFSYWAALAVADTVGMAAAAMVNSLLAMTASKNIVSMTRTAPGVFTFVTSIAVTNMFVMATLRQGAGSGWFIKFLQISTTSFTIYTYDLTGAPSDPPNGFVASVLSF
jgi:hypothetical protein